MEWLFNNFPIKAYVRVRQGGIISPVLFALYIDDLISTLKTSKLGCMINGHYFGCFLYANDILLLNHSLFTLKNMLDFCASLIVNLDLNFNFNKSIILRICSRWKATCSPLLLCNIPLSFVSEMKYLGVVILAGPAFKCSFQQAKTKFYRSFHAILSKCTLV